MYDGAKIVTGLVIGLGLLLSPYFYNAGRASKSPQPELSPKAKEAKECVAPTPYMRNGHMQLLDRWRQDVVRDGDRWFKTSSGKIYNKSLQLTCMECHSNKTTFCDQCHNYMAVTPYCWDCHIQPKEST